MRCVLTAADLDRVTTFFVGLGLEIAGTPMFLKSEFLEIVIGIPDSRSETVMLRSPDGGSRLELSHHCLAVPAEQPSWTLTR